MLRFHAFGDAVITLPVLAGLRNSFPNARIEMVTSAEYAEFFAPLPFLDGVHSVTTSGSRTTKALSLRPLLRQLRSADLVLDLQRSRLSRLLTRLLRPAAWTGFDRFAPEHALERYVAAVRSTGIREIQPSFSFPIADALQQETEERFSREMERGGSENVGPLICLNPAGCWETKNWPPERYAELGDRMVREWNARILLLGTDNVRSGAHIIERELGNNVINLVDKTTAREVLVLVRKLALMVSDDSGLMHLAWTNGIPTLGIFGASRGTWSRPWGAHTRFLGSEDLPCGACMTPQCSRADRICLTRVSVEETFALCAELLEIGKSRQQAGS